MSPNDLVKYDAACRALAECNSVDEVKEINDQAVALAAYARQAKNKTLEANAKAIRLRAERRIGEMMAAQPKAKPSGNNQYEDRDSRNPDPPITLAKAGIDKNLAARSRKAAAIPAEKFEHTVKEVREGRATPEAGHHGTPLARLRAAWRDATSEERASFLAEIGHTRGALPDFSGGRRVAPVGSLLKSAGKKR